MQSIILLSDDSPKQDAYIAQFCTEQGIHQFDKHTFTPEGNSFGIEQVREIHKQAYLAPSKGGKKVLIIHHAQLLTREAQNALLKLLEEPPTSTYIFLLATTENNFLPTILSRCKTIVLSQERKTFSEEELAQYTGIRDQLTQGSVGDKLALAEKLAAQKESLSQLLTNAIIATRSKLLENPAKKDLLIFIRTLQEAQQLLQTTNVSPRELLEHAFLSV